MEIDHVDRLDEVAAALNLTRSDAMRTALLEFMERNAEAAPQHQEALPVAS